MRCLRFFYLSCKSKELEVFKTLLLQGKYHKGEFWSGLRLLPPKETIPKNYLFLYYVFIYYSSLFTTLIIICLFIQYSKNHQFQTCFHLLFSALPAQIHSILSFKERSQYREKMFWLISLLVRTSAARNAGGRFFFDGGGAHVGQQKFSRRLRRRYPENTST